MLVRWQLQVSDLLPHPTHYTFKFNTNPEFKREHVKPQELDVPLFMTNKILLRS